MAASEIVPPGWPDLTAGAPNIPAAFTTGFQAAANVNLRQQQLENQLVQYSLRNQQLEHSREMDALRYDLASDRLRIESGLREKALQQQAGRYEDLADFASRRMDLAEKKDKDRSAAFAGLTQIESELMEEGMTPGTNAFTTEALRRANQRGVSQNLPSTSYNAWHRGLLSNQNANSLKASQTYKTLLDSFKFSL